MHTKKCTFYVLKYCSHVLHKNKYTFYVFKNCAYFLHKTNCIFDVCKNCAFFKYKKKIVYSNFEKIIHFLCTKDLHISLFPFFFFSSHGCENLYILNFHYSCMQSVYILKSVNFRVN